MALWHQLGMPDLDRATEKVVGQLVEIASEAHQLVIDGIATLPGQPSHPLRPLAVVRGVLHAKLRATIRYPFPLPDDEARQGSHRGFSNLVRRQRYRSLGIRGIQVVCLSFQLARRVHSNAISGADLASSRSSAAARRKNVIV
jgi:hypothetical protein